MTRRCSSGKKFHETQVSHSSGMSVLRFIHYACDLVRDIMSSLTWASLAWHTSFSDRDTQDTTSLSFSEVRYMTSWFTEIPHLFRLECNTIPSVIINQTETLTCMSLPSAKWERKQFMMLSQFEVSSLRLLVKYFSQKPSYISASINVHYVIAVEIYLSPVETHCMNINYFIPDEENQTRGFSDDAMARLRKYQKRIKQSNCI